MPKRNQLVPNRTATDPVESAKSTLFDRAREALRVYRPGTADQERVHTTAAQTLVVSGANRSGKSTTGFSEAASRILGVPVFGRDGEPIPLRFPVAKQGEPFEYWFIGHDWNHIGQTIYRILFQPGLFYTIYDPNLERYVAFNENIPWHAANIAKKVPAGPLIPSRYIVESSWTWNPQGGGKEKNGFDSVRLKNGATIRAFPSSAPQAKQGDPVRGMLVDEDVKFGEHVPEYFARLADFGGWFIWPAWPHDENYMLSNLIDGCEKAMQDGDKRFEHIKLSMSDNPYFTAEKKRLQIDRFAILGDEDMVASRVEGERNVEGRRMYDFQPMVHGVSSANILRAVPELDAGTPRGIVQKLYRTKGCLPAEWTRYFAIDPSTTRTAVALGTVPPPIVEGVEMPPMIVLESEIVLKRATPNHVALAIQEAAELRPIEAFIMDRRFGQQTHQSAGMATWDVYANAFLEINLKSRSTENFFIPGCDVPLDRYARVRECLYNAHTMKVQLLVVLDATPQTQKEFNRYYKKKEEIQGVERITDVPENPRKFDCMAALEYLVAYLQPLLSAGVGYVEPEPVEKKTSAMLTTCQSILGRSGKYVHLGPGQSA